MTHALPGIFCTLIAVAGWHYLFYSRAAHRLGEVEQAGRNLARIRLRRINGFVLLLMAFTMFAGFYTVDTSQKTAFVVTWVAVMFLFLLMLILVSVDLWLFARLRRDQRRQKLPDHFPPEQ